MTGQTEITSIDSVDALAALTSASAREAFRALVEWIWLDDVRYYVNPSDDSFMFDDQVHGFTNSRRLDVLQDLAQDFEPDLNDDSFVARLESALRIPFNRYRLGLKWQELNDGPRPCRVLHFYPKP